MYWKFETYMVLLNVQNYILEIKSVINCLIFPVFSSSLQQNHIYGPSFYGPLKSKESFKGMSIEHWWHTLNAERSKSFVPNVLKIWNIDGVDEYLKICTTDIINYTLLLFLEDSCLSQKLHVDL